MKSRKIPIRRHDVFLCMQKFDVGKNKYISPAIVFDCGDDCAPIEIDSAMQKKLADPPAPVLHPGQEWEEENLKLPWWE